MVGKGGITVGVYEFGENIDLLAGGAVDDPGLVRVVIEEGHCLSEGVGFWFDGEVEVFTVKAGDEFSGLGNGEGGFDVCPDSFGGSGGDGDTGGIGQAIANVDELAVFGAKIVAPFGDAVGFVDGQTVYRGFLEE